MESVSSQVLSVRTKITLVVVASIVVLCALMYLITTTILVGSYRDIERDAMVQDLQRVQDAIDEYIRQQGVKIDDWAQWDDSYEYARIRDQEYVDANVNISAVYNLDLHAMVYLELDGTPFNAIAVDRATFTQMPADEIVAGVVAEPEVALHESLESKTDGIILLPSGPLIVNSRPMRQSEGVGPAAGTLVYARYLDEAKVQDIGRLTHLSLAAFRYDDPHLPGDVASAKAELTGSVEDVVVPVNENVVRGYALVNDLHGNPALILRIESPRPIYAQGQLASRFFMAGLAFALLLSGLVVLMLVDRTVIARFLRLTEDVERINITHDIEKKVSVGELDEIGRLGANINRMLGWLLEAREAEAAARREMLNLLDEQKKQEAQRSEMRTLTGEGR